MKAKMDRNLEKEWLGKLKINPEDFEALTALVYLYINSQDERNYNKALDLIGEKEQFYEDKAKFYNLMCLVYRQIEETEETKRLAMQAAKKCVELEEDNPMWYYNLGYTYWWYNDPDKAIELSEKGLKLSEKLRDQAELSMNLIKNNLAYFYVEKNDNTKKEKALKYAEEAYKYNANAPSTDTYGYVLMKFGTSKQELKKARALFLEATKLSDDKMIHQHLDEVEKRIKKNMG